MENEDYPLVICYIAVENGHGNDVSFPMKTGFAMVLLVYQRVCNVKPLFRKWVICRVSFHRNHPLEIIHFGYRNHQIIQYHTVILEMAPALFIDDVPLRALQTARRCRKCEFAILSG